MKVVALVLAGVVLTAFGCPVIARQHSTHSHSSIRSHHSSQGGHYAGGHGSSHRGGHYVNPRTGNHYTKHHGH